MKKAPVNTDKIKHFENLKNNLDKKLDNISENIKNKVKQLSNISIKTIK